MVFDFGFDFASLGCVFDVFGSVSDFEFGFFDVIGNFVSGSLSRNFGIFGSAFGIFFDFSGFVSGLVFDFGSSIGDLFDFLLS